MKTEHRLDTLKSRCSSCTNCELSATRTNVVFGSGNPAAKLMAIGEAPGQDEDEQGLPFVGRSGQLLTKLLSVNGLNRGDDLYIANIIKCRPPGNRKPTNTEIATCLPYLYGQIDIIAPAVILTLGSVPTNALLDGAFPITKIRGEIREITIKNKPVKLIPTFHPSYLIRNGAAGFITSGQTTNSAILQVLGDIQLAKSLRG